MNQQEGKRKLPKASLLQKNILALALFGVVILGTLRIVSHALAEPSISGDGWGYFNRAFYIHENGRLPPLDIQPVGYSILLSRMAFLGKDWLTHVTVRIQQILDVTTILALAYFSWLMSLRLTGRSTRITFFILCSSFLLIQPFTAKLTSGLYTEPFVMALSFLGIGLLSLVISRNSVFSPVDITRIALGGVAMGIASTMRVDVLALNTAFIAIVMIGFIALKLHLKARKVAVFLLSSLILPLCLLLSQLHSTGELGFQTYLKKTYPIEFISWTGSWRADRREHQAFAWFSTDLDNLDTRYYPDKAFGSNEERQAVEVLFKRWKQDGYTDAVKTGFQDIVKGKRASDPFEFYFINPFYRMYHHWVNLEGADFFLSSFQIPSGLASRLIVALIFFLRVAILFLFVYGSIKFCFKAKHAVNALDSLSCISGKMVPRRSDCVVGLSILFVIMRTCEMGLLSTFNVGGLMEPRYVTIAFPSAIAVSIYGFFQLVSSFWGAASSQARS